MTSRWIAVGWYFATAGVAMILTILSLQLWAVRFEVPFQYTGDALSIAAHFKTVIETGWYEYQPLLGAPAGQDFNDFPNADNLHLIAAQILSLFTSNFAIAMNAYFVLGFPLAAVSGLWFLRRVGVSWPIGLALSVAFAIAPYHFYRAEGHLWLGSYFIIPLSLGLVLAVIRGESLWGSGRPSGGRFVWLTRARVGTVLIVVLTGTAQSYYAIFFLVLLAFAGLVALVRDRSWARFWGAAATGAAVVVVMLINMAPDLIFSAQNGANPTALGRSRSETEIYALKLTQLLLPWPGHRVSALQSIRERYDTTYPLPSEAPALGAIAAVGLIALFLVIAYMAAAWASRRAGSGAPKTLTRLGELAALTFVAFLFSTMGGLSSIVSFATASLRGWNRMSIVIALLSLAAVGLLIDALLRHISRRFDLGASARAIAAVIIVNALLVVAYIDQTPANVAQEFQAAAASFDADEEWVNAIEREVPEGSLILQLPYLPFPEYITTTAVLSNDVLIPYLHSDTLRWSGGGIKGRPAADWPGILGSRPGDEIAILAATTGAAGVLIDRQALEPDALESLEPMIRETVGVDPLVSDSGRYSFYLLSDLRDRLETELDPNLLDEIGARVVNPVALTANSAFIASADVDETVSLAGPLAGGSLTVTNDSDDAVPVRLTIRVKTDAQVNEVSLVSSTGDRWNIPLSGRAGEIDVPWTAPVGRTQLTFGAEAVTKEASVRLLTLTLTENAVDRLLELAQDRAVVD